MFAQLQIDSVWTGTPNLSLAKMFKGSVYWLYKSSEMDAAMPRALLPSELCVQVCDC